MVAHLPSRRTANYELPIFIMIFLSGQVHSSSFVDCRPGHGCATKTKSLQDSFIALIFDRELANAVQGITTFPPSSTFHKPFTHFEAYYVMSDMN